MKTFISSVALLLLIAASAQAGSITGLFNTGVDGSGAVLPYGSTDPHYVILTGPSNPIGPALPEKTMDSSGGFPINGPWLGDNTTSRWDSQSSDGHGGEGTGTFDNQTTFTSSIAGTATITGQWATDDFNVGITVDGGGVAVTDGGGFSSWHPFSITGPVTAGINTLDFLQGQGGTPGGVRVEFFSASVVPEPASMVLFGLGAVGLLFAARRRRSA